MAPARRRVGEPPNPHGVHTFDELAARLRLLRAWAGLSYREIHRRVVDLQQARGIPERLVFNTVYRCFQSGRSRLDVELVVDIARVLLGDDARAVQWRIAHQVVAGQSAEADIVSVSWALPDDLAQFAGRRAELDRLLGLPDADGVAGTAVLISAIDGMAGVGKTQLAIHAGHQLLQRGRFTDLQLWVNLRGYDPDRPPADPAAVLGAILRRFGVPGDQVYHLDLAGRAARYRQLLADQRALIVLDDAATEDQVRPLLPDSPGCLVLITSRRNLAGLPVAQRLRLDVFTEPESLDMLRRTAGRGRIDADPDTAARIAHLVGRLPLALGLVASRIFRNPGWSLADHLTRLVERTRRWQLDQGVDVALHASYEALRPDLRRLFRLLVLHPGGDLEAYAAAALVDTDVDTARRHLDELLAGNLLQQKTPGRYDFHDLVRIFAATRTVDDESDSARRDALTRLFDHYLHTATTAVDALYPSHRYREDPPPPDSTPLTPVPPVADPAEAMAWLGSERANLLAAVAHTAEHGWPAHTHRLAATLGQHLDIGGHYGDAMTIHRHALDAARTVGDRDGEGKALAELGVIFWRLARHDQAVDHIHQALAIFRETGDRESVARALSKLGVISARVGHYQEATAHHEQAFAISRELGHRIGEGVALTNLGAVDERIGRYDEAIDHYRQALCIFKETNHRVGEGVTFNNLGVVHSRVGHHELAADLYRRSLTICQEIGYRQGEGEALSNLGVTHERAGRYEQAIEHHQWALALAREIGSTPLEVNVLNNLGQALRAIGRRRDAHRHFEAALALADGAGIPHEMARAHDGVAHLMQTTGRPDQTRRHWQAALTIYTDLHAPEADEIRAHLAALDRDRPT